jgi:hypothetical protein
MPVTFYHVRISVQGELHDEVKVDMEPETLERQILSHTEAALRSRLMARPLTSAPCNAFELAPAKSQVHKSSSACEPRIEVLRSSA